MALERYISDEFSKKITNNNEYLITATITKDIIENRGIDGIIYPSVRMNGQAGLNIAISPSATNKKIK